MSRQTESLLDSELGVKLWLHEYGVFFFSFSFLLNIFGKYGKHKKKKE